MLSLTKKTDYALVALAYLSLHRQEGAAVSARDIAEHFGIPLPILMNVLKELAKARLVTSARGMSGGYTLAAAPEQVTLLEVVTAMEGPVRLARCVNDLPVMGQECPIACRCGIQQAIHGLHEKIHGFLHQMTLADLMQQSPQGAGQEAIPLGVSLATLAAAAPAEATEARDREMSTAS